MPSTKTKTGRPQRLKRLICAPPFREVWEEAWEGEWDDPETLKAWEVWEEGEELDLKEVSLVGCVRKRITGRETASLGLAIGLTGSEHKSQP